MSFRHYTDPLRERIEALDNSPDARRRQVAEKVKSLLGFCFPPRSGVLVETAAENADLVAALTKDAHLVARETAEKRALDYIGALLLAANRHWQEAVQNGKAALWAKLQGEALNRRAIALSPVQMERLVCAVVRARELFLVQLESSTLSTRGYTAPNNMLEATAQYLMVRMGEVKTAQGIAFAGVPMSEADKAAARARAPPIGQAARGNRSGRVLSTHFVQPLVPITETSKRFGRTTAQWFAFIDQF